MAKKLEPVFVLFISFGAWSGQCWAWEIWSLRYWPTILLRKIKRWTSLDHSLDEVTLLIQNALWTYRILQAAMVKA